MSTSSNFMKAGEQLARDRDSWEPFATATTAELKGKSVRGGVVTMASQALTFLMQTGSIIILARLLSPQDFGIQGMVVAMTGFLTVFRDAGLGIATIQRQTLTFEEASTLFWVNVLIGGGLMLVTLGMAPVLAAFYKEPRLYGITLVSAVAFLFNGLTVQHRALLNRTMRFATMAKIDIAALVVSVVIGISMAASGWGYWSLVIMGLSSPILTAILVWIAIPWRPEGAIRLASVKSLLHVGGTVMFNNLVVYLGYNTEKVLLGRFWGSETLGLYGRAYQLANLPMQQLHSSIGTVAYPALSRAQGDPKHLRRSFLEAYSVLISITIPMTLCCALFSEEIVAVVLGAKWASAASIFRLLAPAILALGLVNPFGWFLQSTGRAVRSLNIAFLIAPIVILGVIIGMHYGPQGVALGYSSAMLLLVWPIVAWAKHGTGITAGDYWDAIKWSLFAGVIAGGLGVAFKVTYASAWPAGLVFVLGPAIVLLVYGVLLLGVMGQRAVYRDLLTHALRRPSTPAKDSSRTDSN